MLRMREVRQGVPDREYNYGTYRPAAADLSETFPGLIKSACLTSNFWQPTIYKDDKKLENIQTLFADTAYFQTTGLQLLQGTPKDLGVQGNAFISHSTLPSGVSMPIYPATASCPTTCYSPWLP